MTAAKRPGRTRWSALLPPSELQALHDAIDSGAYRAAALYRRHNLQRYCSLKSVRAYVASRLRANRDHERPPAAGGEIDGVMQRLVAKMDESVAAGTVKPYYLAGMLAALVKAATLDLGRAEDERRAEAHARKMADFRAALARQTADGARPVSQQEVCDLVDQYMRG